MENHLRIVAVTIALAVGIGVLISTPGFAQFKSGTQMVPLTVTVTDRAGHYVPDLPAAAFTIFEDGKPQTVSHFAALEAPVDLALLLDNSSSMRPDFPLAQEAAFGGAGVSTSAIGRTSVPVCSLAFGSLTTCYTPS